MDVTGDAAGDVAVLVESCRATVARCGARRLELFYRRAGRPLARAGVLSRAAGTLAPALAMDGRGDVLVAWTRRAGGLRVPLAVARVRTAGGRWGRRAGLGPAGPQGFLSASLGAGRRAVVAWATQRVSEGDPHGPVDFRVATAAPGGRFSDASLVDEWTPAGGRDVLPPPGIRTAVAGDGRVWAAWTGRTSAGGFTVKVLQATGGTPALVPAAASSGTAVLDDLAVDPSGRALALWTQGAPGAPLAGPGPATLYSALALPGSPLGAPEPVAPASVLGAHAALDPVSGRGFALWDGGWAVRAAG